VTVIRRATRQFRGIPHRPDERTGSGAQLKPGVDFGPDGLVGTDPYADIWVCHGCERALFTAWPSNHLPRSFQCPDCKEWNVFFLHESTVISPETNQR
jgi:phage FluMu protein Com